MAYAYQVTTPSGAVVYTNQNPNIAGNAPAGSTVVSGTFSGVDVVNTNVSQPANFTGVSSGYTSTGGASTIPAPPANAPSPLPPPPPSPTPPPAVAAVPTAATVSSSSATSQNSATSTDAGQNTGTTSSVPLIDAINTYIAQHAGISQKTLTKLEDYALVAGGSAFATLGASSVLSSAKHHSRKMRKHQVKPKHHSRKIGG